MTMLLAMNLDGVFGNFPNVHIPMDVDATLFGFAPTVDDPVEPADRIPPIEASPVVFMRTKVIPSLDYPQNDVELVATTYSCDVRDWVAEKEKEFAAYMRWISFQSTTLFVSAPLKYSSERESSTGITIHTIRFRGAVDGPRRDLYSVINETPTETDNGTSEGNLDHAANA